MEVFPGISMDPDVRFGKPCLSGTRIDVATVVGALAAGETAETVAAEYSLSIAQVQTALAYAAHVAAHQPPAVRPRMMISCSVHPSTRHRRIESSPIAPVGRPH